MKNFLTRIKLIDSLTMTLPTSKADFVKSLSAITDKGGTDMISDTFDVFSSGKNEFKGQVNSNGFKLKRKRRFFDTNMNAAIAQGTFEEQNGQLVVETEINGFNNFFLIFYGFVLIFYPIIIITIAGSNNNGDFIAIPFLLLHGIFMSTIPYFMMRRSVKRMKYELEREFFYLTKAN